ncbi:MAG: hypothetical protein PHF83_05980 [Candidatus Methanomethylophilus sp.]|nr:hypothetical protein [Methanomethylophilus sp.]
MKYRTVVLLAVAVVAVFTVLLAYCLLTMSGDTLTMYASFLAGALTLIVVLFGVAVQAHTESATARYRQMYGDGAEEQPKKKKE